jgi:hypothetical protein
LRTGGSVVFALGLAALGVLMLLVKNIARSRLDHRQGLGPGDGSIMVITGLILLTTTVITIKTARGEATTHTPDLPDQGPTQSVKGTDRGFRLWFVGFRHGRPVVGAGIKLRTDGQVNRSLRPDSGGSESGTKRSSGPASAVVACRSHISYRKEVSGNGSGSPAVVVDEATQDVLSDKGMQLMIAVFALMEWGDRHLAPEGGPVRLRHRDCGALVHVGMHCNAGHAVENDDVDVVPGPALAGDRGAPGYG